MNLTLKQEYIEKNENREDKVLLIDADSLTYFSSYPGKDELGNALPDYTEDEYEYVEGKLRELVLAIFNKVEQKYNIVQYYMCIRGRNNFRKELYPEYKATRPPTPEIVNHLCRYLVNHFGAIESCGAEADDYIYTLSLQFDHKAIIACMDKDLYQIPASFYDYFHEEWKDVDEEEAKYNLAIQVLTGDPGDNVKVNRGLGKAKAAKIVQRGMTDYQYVKSIYLAYKHYNGNDAKEKLRLVYKLLRLHKIDLESSE